jgi:hypothetical protein
MRLQFRQIIRILLIFISTSASFQLLGQERYAFYTPPIDSICQNTLELIRIKQSLILQQYAVDRDVEQIKHTINVMNLHLEEALNDKEIIESELVTINRLIDSITPKRPDGPRPKENIIDILTMMGAQMASLEIMNVKMMKDVKNKINRSMNCDNANIDKALGAAERQISDIELIDSTMGLDSLPDTLRDIARIRYENIDFTLKELGAAMEPPISRSGANHRMQKIAEIAENIRKEKAKR